LWLFISIHFLFFAIFLAYALFTGESTVSTSGVFFLERDPTLSFPYKTEQVSVAMLYGISIGVPATVIFICTLFLFKYKPCIRQWLCIGSSQFPFFSVTFFLLITLLQCLLFTDGVTNTIKILVLRPRPNFFAYCNYKGYNDAMISNNFTSYDAQTLTNQQGSTSSCLSDNTMDPVLSFPSGHSAFSWAGMTFISLLVKYTIGLFTKFELVSYHGILVVAPLYLSGWIAITRIQDFYHHTDDCMMGAFIGASVSYFIFTSAQPFLDENLHLKDVKFNKWGKVDTRRQNVNNMSNHDGDENDQNI
jgi:membrane-associated phospholipid phosphatase